MSEQSSIKESIKDVLLKHYSAYPEMQIRDMVKLIYQNEFAGGHLIKDETDSLNRLKEECRALFQSAGACAQNAGPDIPDKSMFEEIGNGLFRLNLALLRDSGISPETVNRFFINTANSIKGSIGSFEQKLEVLRQCCRENELPYPLEAVDAYLGEYRQQGYPPVSHSEHYRVVYRPSYRIVRTEYHDYFEVFRKIDNLSRRGGSVNVAVDGNCCAGKTTLAALIANVYGCNVFHMDDFFLRPELRTEERMRETGGNVDYVRFKNEVITGLKSGREFKYQIFDCSSMKLGRIVSVTPEKINVIEGSYSMHPALADNYDLKIFLQINKKEQRERILRRNGKAGLARFVSEWIPKENQYFEEMKIKEKCDLIFGV